MYNLQNLKITPKQPNLYTLAVFSVYVCLKKIFTLYIVILYLNFLLVPLQTLKLWKHGPLEFVDHQQIQSQSARFLLSHPISNWILQRVPYKNMKNKFSSKNMTIWSNEPKLIKIRISMADQILKQEQIW